MGFGAPLGLKRSGGWLLQRKIAGTSAADAMGCYPFLACREWSALKADLDDLEGRLVSVASVIDPFGNHDEACLRAAFPDLVMPFKTHYVIDLQQDPETFVCRHHRRNVKKSLEQLHVDCSEAPMEWANDWCGLYGHLIERHGIHGIHTFSPEAFRLQLQVPATFAFRAVLNGAVVGMLIWYRIGPVAYYHLGAHNETGYQAVCSFALMWTAIGHFAKQGLRWLDLGGGSGVRDGQEDGLARFKRGWSTGSRMAYFCGRVLDRYKYDDLTCTTGKSGIAYFPAYRAGEFT